MKLVDLMASVCTLISAVFLGTSGMSLARIQEGTGDSLNFKLTDHNVGVLPQSKPGGQLSIFLRPNKQVDVNTNAVREQMKKYFEDNRPLNPEKFQLTVDDDRVIIIPSEDKSSTNDSKLGTRIVILPNLSQDKDHDSHVDTNERRKLMNEYLDSNDGWNKNALAKLQVKSDQRTPNQMLMNGMLKRKNYAADVSSQNTSVAAENLFEQFPSGTENVHSTNNEAKNALNDSKFVKSELVSLKSTLEPQSDGAKNVTTLNSPNASVYGLSENSEKQFPNQIVQPPKQYLEDEFESVLSMRDVSQSHLEVQGQTSDEGGSIDNSTIEQLVMVEMLRSDNSVKTEDETITSRFVGQCTTPLGEAGRCRSISECALSMDNFSLFLDYVCLRRETLVGICCPHNSQEVETDEKEEVADIQELKQPSEGCGLSPKRRIVGGSISVPHEWSWMVALLRRNKFFCGGVIINDRYVLTAAHCVLGIRLKDLSVRLGEYNFEERTEHQQDISVAAIKRHPMFVTMTFQHDIALLKLKKRIKYSKFIGSICLPERTGRDYSDVKATVVGWGTVSFGGSASPILRQVSVPVWDTLECDKTYVLEKINEAFVCAGSPENGEDACQGDSGGPLMATNSAGRWEVMGIVSWGRRCGDPTYPGVYTNVTNYLEWIKENVL